MSRQLIIALGGGTSAILSIAFITGSPAMLVMANLAPLPLFLVGLGFGSAASTIAVAVGLVLSGFLGGLLAAGAYGLVHALPTWLAVRQSLMNRTKPDGTVVWQPVGAVLCWLTALAAALLIVAAIATHQGNAGLEQMITTYLNEVMGILAPSLPAAERDPLISAIVPFFPGSAAVSWLAVLAFNGLLAQAILARSGRNLRPTPKLAGFTLPDWISWVLVGASALALIGSGEVAYLGRNLAMIIAVPFFVLGAVVVHVLSRRTPSPRVLLVAFYLILLVSGTARLLVAGLGLIEQWAGIRRRVAAAGPLQEDE